MEENLSDAEVSAIVDNLLGEFGIPVEPKKAPAAASSDGFARGAKPFLGAPAAVSRTPALPSVGRSVRKSGK
ncbi:MAG: hypothetical protein U1E65_10535 [Myxococcota bacterium]